MRFANSSSVQNLLKYRSRRHSQEKYDFDVFKRNFKRKMKGAKYEKNQHSSLPQQTRISCEAYNTSNSTCRLCGQVGYWGNECPTRNGVNQVTVNHNSAASAETTSVGGATSRRTSVGSGSTMSPQTTAI